MTAWLQPEPDDASIGVYLGPERVGIIPADAAAAYWPAIQSATFREELPCLTARLAHRTQPPHYLLEIALPPS